MRKERMSSPAKRLLRVDFNRATYRIMYLKVRRCCHLNYTVPVSLDAELPVVTLLWSCERYVALPKALQPRTPAQP
jgi:hypothetical protein